MFDIFIFQKRLENNNVPSVELNISIFPFYVLKYAACKLHFISMDLILSKLRQRIQLKIRTIFKLWKINLQVLFYKCWKSIKWINVRTFFRSLILSPGVDARIAKGKVESCYILKIYHLYDIIFQLHDMYLIFLLFLYKDIISKCYKFLLFFFKLNIFVIRIHLITPKIQRTLNRVD